LREESGEGGRSHSLHVRSNFIRKRTKNYKRIASGLRFGGEVVDLKASDQLWGTVF